MSGKLRAERLLTHLLVLLLILNTLTAVSCTGVGSAVASGDGNGGPAKSALIHMSLDFYGDSETFEEVYQIFAQRPGCRFNIFSDILIGAAAAAVAACRQNGSLLLPDEAGNSPNPGIIAAFMHAEDGMK